MSYTARKEVLLASLIAPGAEEYVEVRDLTFAAVQTDGNTARYNDPRGDEVQFKRVGPKTWQQFELNGVYPLFFQP